MCVEEVSHLVLTLWIGLALGLVSGARCLPPFLSVTTKNHILFQV